MNSHISRRAVLAALLLAACVIVFELAAPGGGTGGVAAAMGGHDWSLTQILAEGAPALTAAQFKELTDNLTAATKKFNDKSDELAKAAEKAMATMKDQGQLQTETKSALDKLLLEHTTLTAEKNKLEARLTEVEQQAVRKTGAGAGERARSVAAQFVEDQKVQEFCKAGTKGRVRFETKAAITSVDIGVADTAPSVVAPQRLPGIIAAPKRRLFVRDLIPVGQTTSPMVAWIQQTGFVNNAAVVSEGTRKPESTIAYEPKITPVATIAHIFKASKQVLDDFAQLRTDFDREMRYGLKQAEEEEILFGDGTGIHLLGIVPQAEAFNPEFQAEHHTRIDDIRLAMLQTQLARLPATGIVMHFIDWAKIELTKDANGQYIFANPLRLATANLWGLPVVETDLNAFETNFLTGAFEAGAQIYDREQINLEISTENEDDFVKNMVTGRCEERLALATFRPEAFVHGAFTAGSGT